MDNLLGVLFFFVVVVFSIAQNLVEKAKEKKSRDEMSKRIKDRNESGTSRNEPQVRQAKPKGAGRSVTIEPGTSGKDLIEALFGQGAADDGQGWTPVPAEKPRPAQRPSQGARTATPVEGQSSQAERMAMERKRAQEHAARKNQERAQQQKKAEHDKARREQQSRQQVMAERQRRKQERQRQQQTSQRAPRRAAGSIESESFVPQNLNDVRRAIVMAEILGPPKALQD